MAAPQRRTGLFPALLKHWRRRRGLSQLDLAVTAGVSARHISFLETGRSVPSPEMVVQLAASLGVPLRQVDALLRAAGHDPVFGADLAELPVDVRVAIDLMKDHHEPFPLVIVDRSYGVQDLNRGALALLAPALGLPLPDGAAGSADAASLGLNLARLTFDPAGAQPLIVNFADVGRQLLWRIQREVLEDPDDDELAELLEELLAMPTLDPGWREPDLSEPSAPALVLHLRVGGTDLRFLTTVTTFQAPQSVLVEQLRIETWFPADESTARICRALARPPG